MKLNVIAWFTLYVDVYLGGLQDINRGTNNSAWVSHVNPHLISTLHDITVLINNHFLTLTNSWIICYQAL
jgi:hypothetical protein